jgi:hypothetical protein
MVLWASKSVLKKFMCLHVSGRDSALPDPGTVVRGELPGTVGRGELLGTVGRGELAGTVGRGERRPP